MKGYTYILASKKGGTLYTGVTTDLPGRIWDHREGLTPGFTSRYGVKRLVWYEEFDWVIDTIRREKAIKTWPREWKNCLDREAQPRLAGPLLPSPNVLT